MVPLWPLQRVLPVLCVLAGIVLAGCSSTEPREQPAAVPEATGEAPVREIWSRRFAQGHDGEFLFMTPVVVDDQVLYPRRMVTLALTMRARAAATGGSNWTTA